MVWAQNLIFSQKRHRERKNHIDNGERPAATTNDEDDQGKIYQDIGSPEVMGCTVVLVSLLRVGPFPRYRRFRFTHDNDENDRLIIRHGKQSTTKSRLFDNRHQRQTRKGNPQSTESFYYSRAQETRKCKCYCRICFTRGDIDAESLHVHAHDKPH